VLVGGPAALAAGAVAVGQRHLDDDRPGGTGVPLAVLPAAAAVLTAGGHWVTLVLDREAEAFLRRRSAPHPRLVLAAVSAVLTVLVVVLDPPGRADRTAAGEVSDLPPADGRERP